jgi:predicted alpha/beta-fold hydrolase
LFLKLAMPIIASDFKTVFPFSNGHFNTVYRNLFTCPRILFQRERIPTADGDFLDLDRASVKSKHVALLLHGLEGNSQSKYILSTALYLNRQNTDVIVLNMRGCSGEKNRLFKSYHSGETDDLNATVLHIDKNYDYQSISLIGFSMGGNMVLKYAGERKLKPAIKCVVAIGAPCDLKGSAKTLSEKSNSLYMKRFLKTLTRKVVQKSIDHPKECLDIKTIRKSKSFLDFDNLYTAPSFGFKDAEDYWKQASSLFYLEGIQTPTYLLSANDDPFLSESCYPYKIAENNPFLFLETPKTGGHIGFSHSFQNRKNTWCEQKILTFISEYQDKHGIGLK